MTTGAEVNRTVDAQLLEFASLSASQLFTRRVEVVRAAQVLYSQTRAQQDLDNSTSLAVAANGGRSREFAQTFRKMAKEHEIRPRRASGNGKRT
jgi:hypothetical protein